MRVVWRKTGVRRLLRYPSPTGAGQSVAQRAEAQGEVWRPSHPRVLFFLLRKAAKGGMSSMHKYQALPPYLSPNGNRRGELTFAQTTVPGKTPAGYFCTSPRGGASPMPGLPRHFQNNDAADIAVFFIPQAVMPGIVGRNPRRDNARVVSNDVRPGAQKLTSPHTRIRLTCEIVRRHPINISHGE